MVCEVCGSKPVTVKLVTGKGPFPLCGWCEMTCKALISEGVRAGTWTLTTVDTEQAPS